MNVNWIRILLLTGLALLFAVPAANADVRVRKNRNFRNKTGDDKTDFHFTLWQKEDNIDMIDWEVDVELTNGGSFGAAGTLECMETDQPEPAHSRLQNLGRPRTNNPDNGRHAIRCWIEDATLPPNARVKVKAKFMLTKWNTMRFHNTNWTGSDPVPAGPNDAFEITDPIDNGNGTFRHVLTVFNDDNA